VTPVRKIGRAVGHGIVGPVTSQALVNGTARRLTAPRRGEAAGPSTADSGLTVLNSNCPALTYRVNDQRTNGKASAGSRLRPSLTTLGDAHYRSRYIGRAREVTTAPVGGSLSRYRDSGVSARAEGGRVLAAPTWGSLGVK
jgi:hypothetical protein